MSKLLRLLLSGFWLSFAFALILAALLLSGLRLALPIMGQHRDEVAAWVSALVGQPVHIGALRAGWHGWGPSIELQDVTVLDAAAKQPVLRCASARIDINLPASVQHWQFEPGLLTVRGAHISLERTGDGGIRVTGWGGGATEMDTTARDALRSWLQRQERLALEDSVLEWRDGAGRVLQFTGVSLQLRNFGERHRVDAAADLPASLGRRLQLAMDVRGDLFTLTSWQGKLYARGTAVELGGWWDGEPPQGLAALAGRVDFELWSDWRNGLEQVEGRLDGQGLHAVRAAARDSAGSGGAITLDALAAGLRWQRRGGGWTMDVDRLSLTRGGTPLPPMSWRAEYRPAADGADHELRLAFDELPVADAAAILEDAGVVPPAWRPRLAAVAPQGMLHDGYLLYRLDPNQPLHVELSGDFNDLSWRADGRLPGAQGLKGHIAADDARGEITLDTAAATLDAPKLFRAPLPLGAAGGHITWQYGEQGIAIDTDELSLHNPDLALRATLHAALPADGSSPTLDLAARFDEGHGEHLSRYLPAGIMHPATVAWLDRAIVNGRVSDGSLRIAGRLADFPFEGDRNGRFDVRFKVGDGILDYAPGWPRLDQIDAVVHFHGRRLDVEAANLKTLASDIPQAQASIADLAAHPARVVVTGNANGPTADLLRYVTESPLRKAFGAHLADVTGGGSSRLTLRLDLPLAKGLPARVTGSIRFDDGSLLFRDSGIDITHIAGTLGFSEAGVSADGIKADLLGQPVTVTASSERSDSGRVLRFGARGTADMAELARRFAPPFAAYLEGSAPWQGELRIPPRKDGWVELQIDSTMKGVKVTLPPPMTKSADEERKLLVQIPLPLKDGRPLHLRYGDIADAQLILDHGDQGLRVARGELHLGGDAAVLPDRDGLRLAGRLAELDVSQWSGLLAGRHSNGPPGAALGVSEVDMGFDTLKAGGRQLDKVQLKAERADAAWNVLVDSDQVKGRIQWGDATDAPLLMDLDRLYLPRFKKGGGDERPDPRRLPPLDIQAKSFRYGALDLGALRLQASRTPARLSFDEIHAHSQQRDLQIKGDWQAPDSGQHSAFTLVYDGDDAGATLTALGFAGVIENGTAHTDMQLKWDGAPTDFALAKAAGSIRFEIKQGRLLDVEPGAGRVLGLLSVQALPRRLTLDFSDLFRKGFYFDTLSGSFAIENGNAQTDNLSMVGPSAQIHTRGRVGLAAEDYDQRVAVIPNLTAGLPVAGVIAGGVGAGAALFLAEKILKPGIDKITQVEYRVTGPWANPSVERLSVQQGKH